MTASYESWDNKNCGLWIISLTSEMDSIDVGGDTFEAIIIADQPTSKKNQLQRRFKPCCQKRSQKKFWTHVVKTSL